MWSFFSLDFDNILTDLSLEERLIFPECAGNIINNIDKRMKKEDIDAFEIGRLLDHKTLLQQNLQLIYN